MIIKVEHVSPSEAVKWDGTNVEEVVRFLGVSGYLHGISDDKLQWRYKSGNTIVWAPGSWIVKNSISGACEIYGPREFESNYRKAMS